MVTAQISSSPQTRGSRQKQVKLPLGLDSRIRGKDGLTPATWTVQLLRQIMGYFSNFNRSATL